MKTKKIIYVSIYSILILASIVSGLYIQSILLFLLMYSCFKIINLNEEIKHNEEQFDNQLKQRHAAYHELYKSCMTLTEDLKDEREKSATLKIKADKYDAAIEKERAMGREKYNRLYKGKKKELSLNWYDIEKFAKDNLGKRIDTSNYGYNGVFYICGYNKLYNMLIVGSNNSKTSSSWSDVGINDDTILKEYNQYLYLRMK